MFMSYLYNNHIKLESKYNKLCHMLYIIPTLKDK